MALSIPERIAQVAEHIAKHDTHGYSQPSRGGDGTTETVALSDGSKVTVHGGDYDCSEMVRVCVNAAISGSYRTPITFMWTGDQDAKLKAQGFIRMAYSASKVRRGDILWVKGHTGVAVGNGKQADAHGDEVGGITGPRRGDQTTHEIEVRSLRSWTYIYRYVSSTGTGDEGVFIAASYRLTATGETNVRLGPSMDSPTTNKRLNPGDSVVCDGFVEANGRIWSTYIGGSGRRLYVSRGIAHSWVVSS